MFCYNKFKLPEVWDDFQRPDEVLTDGSLSPSGHVYDMNVDDGTQSVTNFHYVADVVGKARIAYLLCNSTPKSVAAEFEFVNEGAVPRDHGENAVIGVCEKGFGSNTGNGDGGSVQLAIFRDEWQLFVVEDPIVDPYPVIARGSFNVPLVEGVKYQFAMHYDGDETILVNAPEGKIGGATDPRFKLYWDGDKFGVQMRRPATTDGSVKFKRVGAYL